MLRIEPITLREARRFVGVNHRHSLPPRGHLFSVSCTDNGVRCGVGIAGRPNARHLDDRKTVEILRCCTDGTPNACSKIYGALCQAARALGYEWVFTYTSADEPGTSLKAAGFVRDGETRDEDWSRPSRPRVDRDLFGESRTPDGPKVRWVRRL